MSRAFTRDGDEHALPVVPERAPLPEGSPNYVTARGLALLREEAAALDERRRMLSGGPREELGVIDARRERLAARLASAVVVAPPADADVVRFGATVRVRAPDEKERTYRIVGVDEADAEQGMLAFTSPIARALVGKEPGDVALVTTPRGTERLEVLGVAYGD